jgi:hypothetical protein
MEAICFSEMSVDFQRTTRRCIAEDNTLYNYHFVILLPVEEEDRLRISTKFDTVTFIPIAK